SVDYQSNGGAVVRMELAFGDWAEEAPSQPDPMSGVGGRAGDGAPAQPATPVAILLPEGRLAAAPLLVVAGRELPVASARYAPAAGLPPGTPTVGVHADKQGRLVVDGGARGGGSGRSDLAGRPVLIYVQKVLR
ncbi:MAG: hypothetical protein ABUS79_03285, partial [Pseudomonadota bacterium]